VKPASTNPKVLLSTVYRRFEGDVNDSLGSVTQGIPRFSKRREFSPGLLARYEFRWYCQTRATTVLRHLDEWYERGTRFVHIGLESIN
jgi:hypothetical protein